MCSSDLDAPVPAPAQARTVLSDYVRTKAASPALLPALAAVAQDIGQQVRSHGSLRQVPAASVANVRNDMYLASEAIRFAVKEPSLALDADTREKLDAFKKQVDGATKFIPLWVKVVVAIALGLGTMVGWKRIVVTEIGRAHV